MEEDPQRTRLIGESNSDVSPDREPESQDEIRVNYRYRYYTLPSLRYINVIRMMLFIDAIIAIAFWASGRH